MSNQLPCSCNDSRKQLLEASLKNPKEKIKKNVFSLAEANGNSMGSAAETD